MDRQSTEGNVKISYKSFFSMDIQSFPQFVHINYISVVSCFHHALLQSITFISRLMHSILQNLEDKIYVV